MDVRMVIALYGIAALVGIVILVWFALMFLASRVSPAIGASYARLREQLSRYAIAGAWVTASLAMVGSLYFSEMANYPPCTLCWYQRIAMYPLVLLLAIAAFRRDIGHRLYAIPLAAVGAAIAAYHYLLEWFPQIDTGACSAAVPCTQVWFREFGFISLPLLALIAFLLVITFLLLPPHRGGGTAEDAG